MEATAARNEPMTNVMEMTALDLDAHELRRFKVTGHGAHGHADLRLLDEDDQHHHQGDGQDGRDDGDALYVQAAHLEHLGQEGMSG